MLSARLGLVGLAVPILLALAAGPAFGASGPAAIWHMDEPSGSTMHDGSGHANDGTLKQIDNPVFMPDPSHIARIEEPMVKAFVICPNESIGDMMALISEKRGMLDHTETLDARRVMLTSRLPLTMIPKLPLAPLAATSEAG